MYNSEVKIIILPGWGGSTDTWQEFISKAESKYSVECINLPCFGDEPCPNEVCGVEEYAKFVEAKISSDKRDPDQVGKKSRIVLVGHSFGGQVAAYLVAKHPDIASLLILVAPAVFRPENKGRRILFGSIGKIGKVVFSNSILQKYFLPMQRFFHKLIDARDYDDSSGTKRKIFEKVIREDVSLLASHITTPTLILWGTKDTYTPFRFADKLQSLIKNSELVVFKDGKHGLHLQKPDELLAKIESFIQKH